MINRISFKSHTVQNSTVPKEKNDPLMKWPLRGTAFTNEIGEGLRPIIGSVATYFWIPVFLYIGADVYDKYKNDGETPDPSFNRMTKQALFQGLASVILPVASIKVGQNVFSWLGLAGKDRLTCNTQEKINKVAQTFVTNGNMRAYEDKDLECINKFKDIVQNELDFKKSKNIITKSLNSIKSALKIDTHQNIQEKADKIIKDLIRTRKALLNPSNEFKEDPLYMNFRKALERGETKSVATKSVLTKMLNNNTMQGRMIKTLGGFIALGLSIRPIDKFVEHVVIDKFLGPKIDKISSKKDEIQ